MLSRTSSFDDLATWDDVVLHSIQPAMSPVDPIEDEMEIEPIEPMYIDPRPVLPEVAEIDAGIADLEAKLIALRHRRCQLLASHSLVSYIPEEILSRVFEIGVHEQNGLLPVLSLVSRHWRNVALSTPNIWTYICLDSDGGYPARHSCFMRKLRVYLERSQACKLYVDLDCRYIEQPHELQQMMAELESHLNRCFYFRVSAIDWHWMDIVRNGVHRLGPALEAIYLGLDPSDSEDQAPFTVLSNPCPNLRSVVLEHAPLICVRTQMPSLRVLHLIRDQRYPSSSRISMSFKELVAVTCASRTLEALRIQSAQFLLDGDESVFKSARGHAIFSQLRVLAFNHVDANNLALFLDAGTFPCLVRLAVQMDASSSENMHWLGRLSAESAARFPVLRHLDLKACNIDGAALVPFVQALHQLPSLTGLGLSSPPTGHLGGRLFEQLRSRPTDGEPWILPHLQALCVQNCRDISGHELLQVVRARIAGGPVVVPIRYLKISQCFGLDAEVHQQLTRIVDSVHVY
ncbi:hypothetical protein K488DRAFT_78501 [Vararia minispora EC-137]|uniref:Uncharacterized protein n=1 Tax=Vararia minispora EC-137 TaxID=1314806 RepID=A0ACB8QKN1_9AGAM|nr:hypothetical protein K488DRAFT_78501 [Vararia minispora EC-137]